MKKTLALILAVLVAFSMFAFASSAAGDLVKITFMNNGAEYQVIEVAPGTVLTAFMPEDPTRAPDENAEYIFKGWCLDANGEGTVYVKNTMPVVGTDAVTYYAVYGEKEIRENQSFFEFIESLFARINLIFEYFARIFNLS